MSFQIDAIRVLKNNRRLWKRDTFFSKSNTLEGIPIPPTFVETEQFRNRMQLADQIRKRKVYGVYFLFGLLAVVSLVWLYATIGS